MKSKGRRRLLSALVLGLLVAGCIVSGQFVVVINWGGMVSTDSNLKVE